MKKMWVKFLNSGVPSESPVKNTDVRAPFQTYSIRIHCSKTEANDDSNSHKI